MTKKYVLIGDTHPEMISVAREAARLGLNFKIFLPFYVTFFEASIIKKITWNHSRIAKLADQRTLPKEIHRKSVIRPFMFLYLSSFVFKRLKFEKLSSRSLEMYYWFQRIFLNSYVRVTRPYQTIIYDTYLFKPFVDSNLKVICPHVHPKEVVRQRNILRKNSPNWISKSFEYSQFYHESNNLKNQKVVVLSEYSKSSFIREGFREDAIRVIPIGPINARFTKQPVLENHHKLSIVFVGRLTPLKGIESIIDVVRELNGRFDFTVVGSGNSVDVEYVRNISKGLKIQLILNPPTNLPIIETFSRGDIFLLPSFCEGFSIATLEAMNFGLIPIVTCNSAFPEILMNTNLERFVIKPGEIDAILKLVEEIATLDSMAIRELKKECISISERYSMEKFGQRFWEE